MHIYIHLTVIALLFSKFHPVKFIRKEVHRRKYPSFPTAGTLNKEIKSEGTIENISEKLGELINRLTASGS